MSGGDAQLASWSVDAARLRETLDAIDVALKSPAALAPSGASGSVAFNVKQVAGALRALIDALDRADLDALRALSSVATVSHEVAKVERLGELLMDLRRTFRARLESALSDDKIAVLDRLARHAVPDMLGVLGRADDENSHSDVLRWLLDARCARNVAPAALAALARRLHPPDAWKRAISTGIELGSVSVRREFVFGREWCDDESLDRIDIVICGPAFVLAIENKVWSSEHDGQTACYWAWLETLPALRGGFFLTPVGIPAACPDFAPLSYLELLSCLLEAPASGTIDAAEEAVLATYAKTLARRVLRAELRDHVSEEGA